jgi:hypothetical protein
VLVGFGLDSYVEVASGLVLIWRLRKHGFDEKEEQAAEKKAILFVGITFFVLALYITFESGKKLLFHEHPDESLVGIVLAIVSLIVMPVLARYKKQIAAEINSSALRVDAVETLACSYFSLTLLVGLAQMRCSGGGRRIRSQRWAWCIFCYEKDGKRSRRDAVKLRKTKLVVEPTRK